MENASKALIMVGTILISIMVVSIGVYIINMFGEYTSKQEQQRANQKIAEFNASFLKYEGRHDITAQDIVTVANLAKANNDIYELTEIDANENTYYVKVNINFRIKTDKFNFENEVEKEDFLSEEDNVVIKNASGETQGVKYYTCNIGDVKVSSVTKRVYEIIFTELP